MLYPLDWIKAKWKGACARAHVLVRAWFAIVSCPNNHGRAHFLLFSNAHHLLNGFQSTSVTKLCDSMQWACHTFDTINKLEDDANYPRVLNVIEFLLSPQSKSARDTVCGEREFVRVCVCVTEERERVCVCGCVCVSGGLFTHTTHSSSPPSLISLSFSLSPPLFLCCVALGKIETRSPTVIANTTPAL